MTEIPFWGGHTDQGWLDGSQPVPQPVPSYIIDQLYDDSKQVLVLEEYELYKYRLSTQEVTVHMEMVCEKPARTEGNLTQLKPSVFLKIIQAKSTDVLTKLHPMKISSANSTNKLI